MGVASKIENGSPFPPGIVFDYFRYTEDFDPSKRCCTPLKLRADDKWADKKFILFCVPGAFTPTCSSEHLPGAQQKLADFKKHGVDFVGVISFNDAFVMSGWGRANGVNHNDIIFLSDDKTQGINARCNLTIDEEHPGRWAMVVDNKNKKGITYFASEDKKLAPGQSTTSSAESVLHHLEEENSK